jgi:hypothetical protein
LRSSKPQLGIKLVGVKTKADYSDAVVEFITTRERERPELLEKMAKALARKVGVVLPAKLNECPRHCTVNLGPTEQPSRSTKESRIAMNWCARTHQAFRLHPST